jgi:hypothetical protein
MCQPSPMRGSASGRGARCRARQRVGVACEDQSPRRSRTVVDDRRHAIGGCQPDRIRRTTAIRSTPDRALMSCPGSGHLSGGTSSRPTPPGRSSFQPTEIVCTGTWHGTCSARRPCLPSTTPMPLRPRRVAMPAANLKTPCSMASCRIMSRRCSTPRAIIRSTASAIRDSSSASSRSSSPVASCATASSASGVTRVPKKKMLGTRVLAVLADLDDNGKLRPDSSLKPRF